MGVGAQLARGIRNFDSVVKRKKLFLGRKSIGVAFIIPPPSYAGVSHFIIRHTVYVTLKIEIRKH
jgi:hypothetical protein